MEKIQHHCSTLGADLVAEEDVESGIAFFRGIPYASVTKRWTQSSVLHSLPPAFDATKFGPICPQPAHSSLIQMDLPNPIVESDEFKCLNLNVTVPFEALLAEGQELRSSHLPVMVWVHGGQFKTGSNSNPRYQTQVLSRLAKEAGRPIIIVQINYRLGIFGWAASSDLALEHEPITPKSTNVPDYFGNFGLVDQRNAFEWIQSHIQDFGGDPANVTAFGVSAGSGSLHMHILSGKPLFDRAILMSGSGPTMGPFPLKMVESGWSKLCEAAEISAETPKERVKKLRSLSQDEIMQNCSPRTTFAPLADGKFLPASWHLGDPHPDGRCKDIIIGNVGMEGIIFDLLSSLIPQKFFHKNVLGTFKEASDAELFCKYFGFNLSEEQAPEAYRDAMRFFISVVLFHFPEQRIAETYERKAYHYHFEEPSPYEGKTHGLAVHGQDAVFVFNSERESWPESAQKVSFEMAKLWTIFAYGEEPWLPYLSSKKFMRFGPAGEYSMRNFKEDETRDYRYMSWMREHFDETMRLILSLA
ncbi:alpha/beta-hydrolase [Stipitochalara longipes BDJ]|nr:alpha/beta-hydrolase [Stipitochalara longipes BDJ]